MSLGWVYSNAGGTVVHRVLETGGIESRLASSLPPGAVVAPFVPSPPAVPASVDMAQARLTLHQHGLLEEVEALIAAMPEPQKSAAQIEWEFRPRVRRNSPLVQHMIQHLPLTEQQADQLFIEASTK